MKYNNGLNRNGHKVVDRRSFLKTSGKLSLAMAAVGAVPVTAEAVRFNHRLYKVSKTRLAMGTFVSMTLVHSSKDEAQEAMGRAFEEIDRLTALMSRFDDSTAVAQLNREGYLEDTPPELSSLVDKALAYYQVSGGTFDISVKPIIDFYMESFSSGDVHSPTESQLENLLGRVGSEKIKVKGRSIRFEQPGMGITLDGIAKGFIVDKASGVLNKYGIDNYLINGGGDIRTKGARKDRKPWKIAIQDPQKEKEYPDIIHMNDRAIATSGNYEVYFDREKMFHHIVNPKTGLSPRMINSASVMAKTTMDADALSTGIFVMGPSQGKRFIDSTPGAECLLLGKGGKKFQSRGWKNAEI